MVERSARGQFQDEVFSLFWLAEGTRSSTLALKQSSVSNTLKMDLKAYVEDDQYEALRARFLHSGRGRPKSLPQCRINNRLLLQLACLKEEGCKPWSIIDVWLEELIEGFPHIQEAAAATQFQNLVQSTVQKFRRIPDESKTDFLSQNVDLDFISEALSSLGITKRNFMSPPLDKGCLVVPIRAVVDMDIYRRKSSLPKKTMFEWLVHLGGFDLAKLPYAVNSTIKLYISKLRNAQRNPNQFQEFLKSGFEVKKVVQMVSAVPSPSGTPSSSLNCDNSIKKSQKSKDCENCIFKTSQCDSLLDVIRSVQSEKRELEKKMDEWERENVCLRNSVSSLTEELKAIKREDREVFNLKKKLRLSNIKKKHFENELSVALEEMSHLQKLMVGLKQKKKSIAQELSVMKKEHSVLLSQTRNESKCDIEVCLKRDKNAYTDDVRKTVLLLMVEAGVAASKVGKAMDIVSTNIFHYIFKESLPSTQTCLNICDEGFVLSNIQSTEAVLSSSNVTLHSDGTSRDQKKIVGHQLTVDSGKSYFLGFQPVACEDSDTLVEVTVDVLKTMAESYIDIANVSPNVLLKELFSKLTSTMTDRAAAMKLYGQKLEQHLQNELESNHKLNFLHCNAHFLLGLSSACEKALCSKEQDYSSLGRDKCDKFSHFSNVKESATSRLIRMTCEVVGPRGDQKNGCRAEWIVFCENSTIPSFKSNRFNCFFEAAATIIFHLEKLRSFFTSGVLREDINLKIQSVSLDVQDEILVCFASAVALFYLKVTGPYWKIINSSKITYSQFHLFVQKMHSSFQDLLNDPKLIFDRSFLSVFGEESCITSPTWEHVHSFIEHNNSDLVCDILKALVSDCIIVLERQLSDFLPNGCFFSPSTDVSEQIAHCPVTNLIGESAFGDFDYDVSKRRNASLHNRSVLHSVKRNKTVSTFLNRKPLTVQKRLFSIARQKAPEFRKKKRQNEEAVKNSIRAKFLENQEKKINKTVDNMAKESTIEEGVKAHGGPCESSQGVQELFDKLKLQGFSKSKMTDCFKAEIRFQKVVKGKKLKLGDLDFMIESLKNCFECPSPPSKKRKI